MNRGGLVALEDLEAALAREFNSCHENAKAIAAGDLERLVAYLDLLGSGRWEEATNECRSFLRRTARVYAAALAGHVRDSAKRGKGAPRKAFTMADYARAQRAADAFRAAVKRQTRAEAERAVCKKHNVSRARLRGALNGTLPEITLY